MDAHSITISFPNDLTQSTESVDIGVVDSVFDVPDAWNLNIVNRENPLASDARDTTGHGTDVLYLLQYFAPNARFHLYRILADDEKTFTVSNFLKAFNYAIDNELDFLNISAGIWRPNCTEENRCRLCDTANQTVESGVCIVAGAGQLKTTTEDKSVFCPAFGNGVIAVGTSVAKCTARMPMARTLPGSRSDVYPPGAFWIKYSNIDFDELIEGSPEQRLGFDAYCGGQNCHPACLCIDYRKEIPWIGNVNHSKDSPDILAPGPYPSMFGNIPILDMGTSFATPIVVASLARVYAELRNSGIDPLPSDLKYALKVSADSIEESDILRLNVDRLLTSFLGS